MSDDVLADLKAAAAAKWRGDPSAQQWGLFARAAAEIERLRLQVKQADERGDEAMRRAHEAEAEIERLRADAALVRAQVLEEAARVCDAIADKADDASVPGSDADGARAHDCADAIRALKP